MRTAEPASVRWEPRIPDRDCGSQGAAGGTDDIWNPPGSSIRGAGNGTGPAPVLRASALAHEQELRAPTSDSPSHRQGSRLHRQAKDRSHLLDRLHDLLDDL